MPKRKVFDSTSQKDQWKDIKEEFPNRIHEINIFSLKPIFKSNNGRVYISPNAHNIMTLEKNPNKYKILIDSVNKTATASGINETKRLNSSTLRDIYQISFITGEKIFNNSNEVRLISFNTETFDLKDFQSGKQPLYLLSQQSTTDPNTMIGNKDSKTFLEFGSTQDFDNFININNSTYSLLPDRIPDKKIKKIQIKTDGTTLLHKIRGKGINSDGIETDIDLLIDNAGNKNIPFIFRPIDIENGKLLLNTHWLDYSISIPLSEAEKFNESNGQSIESFFNNDPVADMIADCIKLTQAYKTNFVEFRYTKQEWQQLSAEEKNNVHPGDIKADSVIGGLSVFGLSGKDPRTAVNSIMTEFLSKNPLIARDKKLMKKITRFLTATSEYNQTMYSTGADAMYHKAYLPWYLVAVSQIDSLVTKSISFKLESEYFEISNPGGKVTPKEKEIEISKARIFELDREMSEPIMPANIVTTNRSPLPSQLDLNTNEGMEYIIWLSFINPDYLTSFFQAIENSVTKEISINNPYPNTEFYFKESNKYLEPSPPGVTNLITDFKIPSINGVNVNKEVISTKDSLENKVLNELGFDPNAKPKDWVFNAQLSQPVTIKVNVTNQYWDDSLLIDDKLVVTGGSLPFDFVRWENISYSYKQKVTQGELQDKKYVFDKQDIIDIFRTYTGTEGIFEADISSENIKAITELTLKHYYGDSVGIRLTFEDDSTYDIDKIQLKSAKDEGIGETVINF